MEEVGEEGRREETQTNGVAERLSDKEREVTHTRSSLDLKGAASFKAEVLQQRRY